MVRLLHGLPPGVSLILATAFWGIGTVISKELLSTVPPVLFLVIQLAPSVVALWLTVLANGTRPVFAGWLLPVLSLGLLNPGFSYTLSMLGLAQTSASVATLLWAAEPGLIVVLAWLLLREAVSIWLVMLTATAAFGVILASGISSPEDLSGGTGSGEALILAGVLCCAFYTVLSRRIAMEVDPLFMVATQQSIALLWVLAIWPIEQQGSIAALTAREWAGGLVSGLMYYAAAYWLYLNGLRSMAASKAGNFFSLIPVFGIATAHISIGERLSPIQWLGAAIILVSVFLIQRWTAAAAVQPSQS